MPYAYGCTSSAQTFIFVDDICGSATGCAARALPYPLEYAEQPAFRPRCLFACLPVGMENWLPADPFDRWQIRLNGRRHDWQQRKAPSGLPACLTVCMSALMPASLFAWGGPKRSARGADGPTALPLASFALDRECRGRSRGRAPFHLPPFPGNCHRLISDDTPADELVVSLTGYRTA